VEWQQQVPNEPGFWLWMDDDFRVEVKYVSQDRAYGDGDLRILWSSSLWLCKVSDLKEKLGRFLLLRPYPRTPDKGR